MLLFEERNLGGLKDCKVLTRQKIYLLRFMQMLICGNLSSPKGPNASPLALQADMYYTAAALLNSSEHSVLNSV
jgi:hypothetical protein